MITDPIDALDLDALWHDWPRTWEACRNLPDVDMLEGRRENIHFYWRVPAPFERKQIIPIKSFIATQNLDQWTINLWSNVDLSENEWLKPWLRFVTLRHYDPVEEAKDTILRGRPSLVRSDDPACFLGGDLFRAMILHKYGGVYCDMDSVFLRDIRTLVSKEFMYRWGRHPDYISSAIMMLHKNSELSNLLMEGIVELPAGGTNWACQNNMRAREILTARGRMFRIYPSGFFNPEWQIPTRACTFEINEYSAELFEGTYLHHWHNRYQKTVLPGCKFELLERVTDERLKAKGLL